MKTYNQSNPKDRDVVINLPSSLPSRCGGRNHRLVALFGVVAGAIMLAAQSTLAGSIFVISMSDHNFTQSNPTNAPQQILHNTAAPYINSLITPGNSNSMQVSYDQYYFNVGLNVHPEEPNSIWAEAGTDFGVRTDADPSASRSNSFNTPYILTTQLQAAGVSWKNYQEDLQYASNAFLSAFGQTNITNRFYGTGLYGYAAWHNPMAFFPAAGVSNVFSLNALTGDLISNTVAEYNWISPNIFNGMFTNLNTGFTYKGIHYTADQAAVAQGDNFLSIIVPQIMQSRSYQSNGLIIIWFDQTIATAPTNTLAEIIISPLAKGNAYESSVVLSHSSDIKTIEEIFNLPSLNNAIPSGDSNLFGDLSYVASANDLSDLFKTNVIPVPAVTVTPGPLLHFATWQGVVIIKNTGTETLTAPVFLAFDNLTGGALIGPAGHTAILPPIGSPYLNVITGTNSLKPGNTTTVPVQFSGPGPISYTPRVLNVTPSP